MKKLTLVVSFILVFSTLTFAQEENKVSAKKSRIEIYGFVRSDYYYDSYKGVNAAQDNFYLFPDYKGLDAEGNHINQQGLHGFTAMATRLGLNISGPEILGAKTTANIETDFVGIVTEYPELFRLRKAYVKLNWEKSSLLIGQTWHPLWNGSGAFFPQVGGFNTGSPYNPFNRSPQIDFDYKLGERTTLSLTALYEQQYATPGFYNVPNTNSKNLAKRNAGIPEMVAGIYYNGEGISLGLAGQFNAIQPIDVTEGTDGQFQNNELNTSYAVMSYIGYKKDKWFFLLKELVGQNLTNMLMIGGYGVKSYDDATGAMTYTNYTTATTLINAVYGTKFQVGILAGISLNYGTSDELYNFGGSARLKGLRPTIDQIYRVAPYFAYNYKNLRFVAEYELDSADYGTGTFNFTDGLYEDTVNATNHRILMMLTYYF